MRSVKLKTALTRKRKIISLSVLLYLLLCSSTETSPWSQSLKGLGMLVLEMMWIVFWKMFPFSFLNSAEVQSLTRTRC